MLRKVLFAAFMLSVVFIIGCGEAIMDDSRFRVDPEEAAVARGVGFCVPGASEVDLVENMAANRSEYRAGLEVLVEYYRTTGNATKLRWAEKELAAHLVQYRYLMPAEAALANLRATNSMAAADELYEDAMAVYQDAGGLIVIKDDDKMRQALNKFNLLISTYPSSDKIDESAYRAGRIYEHFRDYEIAAVYYQRAFQWSATTSLPARFRAAYMLDHHLHMRKEALVLYKLAYEKESRFAANAEYARKRIAAMTRPKAVSEPEPESPEAEGEGQAESSE